MGTKPQSSSVRGLVIFDLDGTLTVPHLDFDAIRAEIGLPPGPILEALAVLPAAERARALAVLDRHEQAAAHHAELHAGAAEVLETLRACGWPVAILTRNARRWAEVVINRFELQIDALRTRDDGVIKPSPAPIFELCATTNCDPRASWMVGDHLFDLQSGKAAGCATVLMLGNRPAPPYVDLADHAITRLTQLPGLLPDAHSPPI